MKSNTKPTIDVLLASRKNWHLRCYPSAEYPYKKCSSAGNRFDRAMAPVTVCSTNTATAKPTNMNIRFGILWTMILAALRGGGGRSDGAWLIPCVQANFGEKTYIRRKWTSRERSIIQSQNGGVWVLPHRSDSTEPRTSVETTAKPTTPPSSWLEEFFYKSYDWPIHEDGEDNDRAIRPNAHIAGVHVYNINIPTTHQNDPTPQTTPFLTRREYTNITFEPTAEPSVLPASNPTAADPTSPTPKPTPFPSRAEYITISLEPTVKPTTLEPTTASPVALTVLPVTRTPTPTPHSASVAPHSASVAPYSASVAPYSASVEEDTISTKQPSSEGNIWIVRPHTHGPSRPPVVEAGILQTENPGREELVPSSLSLAPTRDEEDIPPLPPGFAAGFTNPPAFSQTSSPTSAPTTPLESNQVTISGPTSQPTLDRNFPTKTPLSPSDNPTLKLPAWSTTPPNGLPSLPTETPTIQGDIPSLFTPIPTRDQDDFPPLPPSFSGGFTNPPAFLQPISPTSTPSAFLLSNPTSSPTGIPTSKATSTPTVLPTSFPTSHPTSIPTSTPTAFPTSTPISNPTALPTSEPTIHPTSAPTSNPSALPTSKPTSAPTPSPTSAPTAPPTSIPTSNPTAFPTSAPTAPPSSIPTSNPTNSPNSIATAPPSSPLKEDQITIGTIAPTMGALVPPTKLPTLEPTTRPTAKPTTDPTFLPSSLPTKKPTRRPTSEPSPLPTTLPSISATMIPTSFPTRFPTFTPTLRPTARPTPFPTPMPTSTPTAKPTSSPSVRPTIEPSLSPSWISASPTGYPTRPPTSEPTPETWEPTKTRKPTMEPSDRPTSQPSIFPTKQPTGHPSIEPTPVPSPQPSMMPSLPFQDEIVELAMAFSGIDDLSRGGQPRYQSVTENFIRDSINKMFPEGDVFQLDVQISTIRVFDPLVPQASVPQASVPQAAGVGSGSQRGRRLQSAASLIILADAYIKFKSTNSYTKDKLKQWVKSAFDDGEEQLRYLSNLRQASDDFELAVSVEVTVEGETVPMQQQLRTQSSSSNNGQWIVLGAAVLGLLALALLGVITVQRVRAHRLTLSTSLHDNINPLDVKREGNNNNNSTTQVSGPRDLQTEILVENQEDISTLGDPVYGGGMAIYTHSVRDERTASVGDNYDYAKQYLLSQGVPSMDEASRSRLTSTDSGKSSGTPGVMKQRPLDTSLFADDASFGQQYAHGGEGEYQFDIEVPAGKLGMVIDTPNGSVPVVHAIKPDSVLANLVRVGDRLVSVDGEDVTDFTAIQVSKLISLKSDETRQLSFVRSRTRDDSLDQLPLE